MTAPPFVGLTGGIGAGKSEALAALERLGAATISTDAVVHELYDDPEVRAAVVARWGDEVAPGRAGRPLRRRAARVRRPTRTGAGSRACCGRGSGARIAEWREARVARASRRRARWWSRRRCCSRPAWRATTTRRSRSSPTRRSARERARGARARGPRRAHRATADTGREGRAGHLRCRELRHVCAISSRSCLGFLRS